MTELLIDLASARLGGDVLEASDEFFGKAERLIAGDPPAEIPGDRWETRRRRSPGHEWAILRLGLAGVVRRVIVDTSHVTGSHPAAVSVEAIHLPGSPHLVDVIRRPERWQTIVPRTAVEPDGLLRATVEFDAPATHLRVVVYPDGAVARLRVLGEPIPGAEVLDAGRVDLAAAANGARVIDCSDAHFGSPTAMLLDDRRRTDPGWLTRRRRDDRHDWAVIRLAGPGTLDGIVVDTRGFEGDAPAACSIEGVLADTAGGDLRAAAWQTLLPRTALRPDHRHEFSDLDHAGTVGHLRLSIHPDGGINRFAAFGSAVCGWHQPRPPSLRTDGLEE